MGKFKPSWDVNYDCKVLPNVSIPCWNISGNINLMSIVDGMLYINDNSSSIDSALIMNNIVGVDKITTIECEIKIVNANTFFSIQMQINDGNKGVSLGLEPNKLNVINSNPPQIIKSVNIDLTSFNVVKIIKYEQKRYEVYVNDILVIEGINSDFHNISDNSIYLGAGSTPNIGSCYIRNVRYCLNGIPIYYPNRFLIKQNNNYYSIKSNFHYKLGVPKNDIEKENWYKTYGTDDLSGIMTERQEQLMPMIYDESTGIYKSLEINANDINTLIEFNQDKQSIHYDLKDKIKPYNELINEKEKKFIVSLYES